MVVVGGGHSFEAKIEASTQLVQSWKKSWRVDNKDDQPTQITIPRPDRAKNKQLLEFTFLYHMPDPNMERLAQLDGNKYKMITCRATGEANNAEVFRLRWLLENEISTSETVW